MQVKCLQMTMMIQREEETERHVHAGTRWGGLALFICRKAVFTAGRDSFFDLQAIHWGEGNNMLCYTLLRTLFKCSSLCWDHHCVSFHRLFAPTIWLQGNEAEKQDDSNSCISICCKWKFRLEQKRWTSRRSFIDHRRLFPRKHLCFRDNLSHHTPQHWTFLVLQRLQRLYRLHILLYKKEFSLLSCVCSFLLLQFSGYCSRNERKIILCVAGLPQHEPEMRL